jgi:hypothetical protein
MKASFQAHTSAASPVSSSFTLPAGCPMPLYRIGQRVLWKDRYATFNHEVIGTICGFEYLDHPDYISGWSYILNVEEAKLIYADGSFGRFTTATVETAKEHEITLLTQECVSLVKLAS